MNEAEKYLRKKRKIYYYLALLSASLMGLTAVAENSGFLTVKGGGMSALLPLLWGMVFAIIGMAAATVSLKSPARMEKYRDKFEDERAKYIEAEAGKCAFKALLFILFFSAIYATYFNRTVSITLFGALFAALIVYAVANVYFSKKH